MITKGMKVKVHYSVVAEGKVVDTTEGREPLVYVQGQPKILAGFQDHLEGCQAGDECAFTLSPEEGYGKMDPAKWQEVPKSEMPDSKELEVGMVVQDKKDDGTIKVARIIEIKPDSVILSFQHPMVGKSLHFKVTILEVSV